MSIKSQQIWRKVGAGFLIVLLLLFLTDYFRVKASAVEVSANLEYNQVLSPSITLEVKKAFMHPGINKDYYFEVVNIMTNNKAYPYLQGKDIYLQTAESDVKLLNEKNSLIVTGKVLSNNYGMLKMIVEKVSSDY